MGGKHAIKVTPSWLVIIEIPFIYISFDFVYLLFFSEPVDVNQIVEEINSVVQGNIIGGHNKPTARTLQIIYMETIFKK